MSIGVAGLGDTGTELARVFADLPGARLAWLCDSDPTVRLWALGQFPASRSTSDFAELLDDEELDAVVVATPLISHYDFAIAALRSDKHVLVAEPLVLTSAQADELVSTAARRHRCLTVGHHLLFHPAITRLKDTIAAGHLGEVYFLYGNRQDLGQNRPDRNALWTLATQDLAVVLHLLDDQPIEVAAHGEAYLQQGVPDVVFCYVKFATGISAHLHVSWLDPNKLRRLTVIGSKEMAVFDDTQPVGKLSLYERTRDDLSHRRSSGAPNIGIGTIVSPRLPCDAPLRLECEDFIAAARAPARSAHGARLAAAVVHVLAGLQQSLDLGGAPVPLGTGFEPAASVAAHPVTRLIQGGRGA